MIAKVQGKCNKEQVALRDFTTVVIVSPEGVHQLNMDAGAALSEVENLLMNFMTPLVVISFSSRKENGG